MNNVLHKTVFGSQLTKTYTLEEILNMLASKQLLNYGELTEQAISKKSKVAQCDKNTPGIDLVSGVQIKYAQTNYNTQSNKGSLWGYISKKKHVETILAVVTETVTNKQYFFEFKHKDYKHINGNTFGIPFELDGTPRRSNYWWLNEVPSFNCLCELAKC